MNKRKDQIENLAYFRSRVSTLTQVSCEGCREQYMLTCWAGGVPRTKLTMARTMAGLWLLTAPFNKSLARSVFLTTKSRTWGITWTMVHASFFISYTRGTALSTSKDA